MTFPLIRPWNITVHRQVVTPSSDVELSLCYKQNLISTREHIILNKTTFQGSLKVFFMFFLTFLSQLCRIIFTKIIVLFVGANATYDTPSNLPVSRYPDARSASVSMGAGGRRKKKNRKLILLSFIEDLMMCKLNYHRILLLVI